MDREEAYWQTATRNFSYDVIVFDHYPIISDDNRMLDKLRRLYPNDEATLEYL